MALLAFALALAFAGVSAGVVSWRCFLMLCAGDSVIVCWHIYLGRFFGVMSGACVGLRWRQRIMVVCAYARCDFAARANGSLHLSRRGVEKHVNCFCRCRSFCGSVALQRTVFFCSAYSSYVPSRICTGSHVSMFRLMMFI